MQYLTLSSKLSLNSLVDYLRVTQNTNSQIGSNGSDQKAVNSSGELDGDSHKILKPFPLGFVNQEDENAYLKKLHRNFGTIGLFQVTQALRFVFTFWVIPTIAYFFQSFPLPGKGSFIFFHCFMTLCVFSLFIPYIMLWQRPSTIDFALQIPTILTTSTYLSWVIYNTVNEYGSSPEDVIRRFEYLNWRIYATYAYPIWICLKLNLNSQTSTHRSHITYFGNPLLLTIANVVEAVIYVKLNKLTTTKSYGSFDNFDINHYIIGIATINSLYSIIICSIIFTERYCFEYADRLSFYEIMKSIRRIRELRKIEANKHKKGFSSIVEDLSTMIKCVVNNLEEISFNCDSIEITESVELLEECYRILIETNDLYSIYDQTNANVSDDNMQEQFINIYANRSLKRSSTRVRFSQVTNATYEPITEKSKPTLNKPHPTDSQTMESPKFPFFSIKSRDSIKIGKQYNVNFLELEKQSPNFLAEVGSILLLHRLGDISCTKNTLHTFLLKLQNSFLKTAFHNTCHTTAGAHVTSLLISIFGIESIHHRYGGKNLLLLLKVASYKWSFCIISDLPVTMYYVIRNYVTQANIVATIVAVLGHCVAHPGYTNNYLINTDNTLAILYNDQQVLQNVHSSILFFCLKSPQANIFSEINPDELRNCRKRIIELILSLDESNQLELIFRFRMRKESKALNISENHEDLWLLLKLVAGFGCHYYNYMEWTQHLEWSYRLFTEYYNQELQEIKLNMTIPKFTEIQTFSQFSNLRIVSMQHVAAPLIEQLKNFDKTEFIEFECNQKFKENLAHWEELRKSSELLSIPKYIKVLKGDPIGPLKTFIYLYINDYRSNLN